MEISHYSVKRRWTAKLLASWLAAALIGRYDVAAVPTKPQLVTNSNYASYPTTEPVFDLKLAEQGYTLYKIQMWKTDDVQLDGFRLYFRSDTGGQDVISEYGYICEKSNSYSTLITKEVIKVTNCGSQFTSGFIFHHEDGTTTETKTIPANRDLAKDQEMVLCGNFIGFKCSFKNGCDLNTDPASGAYGTNGCSAYYDGDLKFTSKSPDIAYLLGDPSITISWTFLQLPNSCTKNSSNLYKETSVQTFVYAKGSPGIETVQPSWLTQTDNSFTIASFIDTSQTGLYTVTITKTRTISYFFSSAIVYEATDSFTITVGVICDLYSFVDHAISDMSVNVTQVQTLDVAFADTSGVPSQCGARTYTVSSVPTTTIFSVTNTTFQASPTLPSDVGDYLVTLTASLTRNPTKQIIKVFKVSVFCQVLSLNFSTEPPPITEIRIGIDSQPINLPFTTVKTPDCPQEVLYSLSNVPPGFISLGYNDRPYIQINGATSSHASTTAYTNAITAYLKEIQAFTTFSIKITDIKSCSTAVFTIVSFNDVYVAVPDNTIIEQSYVVKNSVTEAYPEIVCDWEVKSLSPIKIYMSFNSGKILIDLSKITLQDVGYEKFKLTVGSLSTKQNAQTESFQFKLFINDICEGAFFEIQPIPLITVQIPGNTVVEQSYVVTKSPPVCDFASIRLNPIVDYITNNSSTIRVDLALIPMSEAGTKTFTLEVIPLHSGSQQLQFEPQTFLLQINVAGCSAWQIDTSLSVLRPVVYTILLSDPDEQQFSNVNFLVSDPAQKDYLTTACGEFSYSVAEPFITIKPSSSLIDQQTLTVDTRDISMVGTHQILVKVMLIKDPAVNTTIPLQITFKHPCINTQLVSLTLADMTYEVTAPPTLQEFFKILDVVGYKTNQPELCGQRIYRFFKAYPFLSVAQSDTDPSKMKITLATNDPSKVGIYAITLVVALQDYPLTISLKFKCTILEQKRNNLPYFETSLPAQLDVTMTEAAALWEYKLPKILDQDNDQVQLKVQLGESSLFVDFDPADNSFTIQNTQPSTLFKEGSYSLQLALSDSKDVVKFNLTLKVAMPQVIMPTEATNSTQTKTNLTETLSEELLEQLSKYYASLMTKKAEVKAETQSWQQQPPKPFKKQINMFGQVTIGFLFPIYVAPNITMIGNGKIMRSQLMKQKSQYAEGRVLQVDDEEIPILEVKLIPGSESNSTYLNYTWNLVQQTENDLSIQVNFQNATAVSSNPVSHYK